jgi:hypothetical protein
MDISWFFLLDFFLYYYYSFSFDNDVATFFEEGAVGKKKKNCLNFRRRIINFCNHYHCCRAFEL